MKKAKGTLANLSGLGALRLAREPETETKKDEPKKTERRAPSKKAPPAEESPAIAPAVQVEQPRSVGRPKTGKRSNEDYRNVTVYIRKQTHADADDLLRKRRRSGQIPPGEPQDVSELVEDLLSNWLLKQGEKQ